MVREEDVLMWFKRLESYKRVDVLCGLLDMCLPFELRFAGTYVEELGKRDFQELRGAELRANNPDELAGEVGGAQPAGDPRAPRRMALYVSLLRSCNAACARTLHKVLLGLERAGLLRAEPLDELLLLYTMALHHPAFTFDQRSHFGDILERLKAEERRCRRPPQPQPQSHPQPQPQPEDWPPACVACPACVQPAYRPSPVAYVYVKEQDRADDAHEAPPVLPPPTFVQPYGVLEYRPHWPEPPLAPPEMLPQEMYFPAHISPLISRGASPCDSRPASPDVRAPPPVSALGGRQMREAPLPARQQPGEEHRRRRLVVDFGSPSEAAPGGREPSAAADGPLAYDLFHMRLTQDAAKMNGLQRAPPGGKGRFRRSSGSDSGSSAGSRSPPETPAAPRPRRPSSPPYPQPPPQPPPPAYYPQPQQRYPTGFAPYRPGYAPFAPNGEAYPPYAPPYRRHPHLPPYAPPKPSCWNCGSAGHSGGECKEPSIEEVTRAGGYQLDYSAAPPDADDK